MQKSNTRLFHAIKLACPLKNREQMTDIYMYIDVVRTALQVKYMLVLTM